MAINNIILSRSMRFLLLAPFITPVISSQSYCNGDTEGTKVGDSLSSLYGKVVIIGDSLLDGSGSTDGHVEETLSALLSETFVENNAVGGFSLDDIGTQLVAGSCYDSCKWSVVSGGINGMYGQSVMETINAMQEIVDRELAAEKRVIIQGYVPDCNGYASGDTFNAFLDGYRELASTKDDVWFVDPRDGLEGHPLVGMPCEDDSNIYRIEKDNSHPTPFSGELMATAIADIIKSQDGEDEDDEDESESLSESEDKDEDEDEDEEDCQDDPTFKFKGKRKKKCHWVKTLPKKKRRLLCRKKIFQKKCPKTCFACKK